MKRIYFVGASAKERIQECFILCLSRWARSWCFDSPDVCLFADDTESTIDLFKSETLTTNAASIQRANTPIGNIFLCIEQGEWDSLLFGQHSREVPSDSIRAGIIIDAKKELCRELISTLLSESTSLKSNSIVLIDDVLSRVPHENTSEFFTVSLKIRNTSILFYIPMGPWLDNFKIDVKGTRKETLTKRPSCLKDIYCEAQANLDLGKYSIDIIKNLAVGDILSSEKRIDTPFYLSVANRKIADVSLGKSGNSIAVRLNESEK